MDKEKDYSNLHRGLVIKYFWQVMRNFKISFFILVFGSITRAVLDIYVPFQLLKLWNVLSTNNFDFVSQARSIVVTIFILGLLSWALKRVIEFSSFYFAANVIAGLRSQAFSYMMGNSRNIYSCS